MGKWRVRWICRRGHTWTKTYRDHGEMYVGRWACPKCGEFWTSATHVVVGVGRWEVRRATR